MVGDMQITITAGLSGNDKDDGGVVVNNLLSRIIRRRPT